MTRWEEFLKRKRIKSRREMNIAREAWINGLEEAAKLIKIAARADAIDAGLDFRNVDYEETYARSLEEDIEQYVEMFKERK